MTSLLADAPPETRLLDRMRGEYLDMPGLSLTDRQARRLWALEHHECDEALRQLVGERFLRRTDEDRYVRADRSL